MRYQDLLPAEYAEGREKKRNIKTIKLWKRFEKEARIIKTESNFKNYSAFFRAFRGQLKNMSNLIYEQETYKILGACFEVYKQKGCGFTEPVYQECLSIEFEIQNIPFVAQPKIQLEYKGRILNQFFVPDFICFNKLIIEIKALPDLIEVNKSQTLNYLNATNFELALLVNFGHYPKLEHKRIANTRNKSSNTIKDELKSWI